MTTEQAAHLEYHQMPQDGGQIVSVTYAVDDEWSYLYCRSEDQGELPGSVDRVRIERAEIDQTSDRGFEPWNSTLPKTVGGWETLRSRDE
jgi:hypothetical protein